MCTKFGTHCLFVTLFHTTFAQETKKTKLMAVVQVTSREFRSEQARLFGLADSGEQIIIRRGKKQAYTLVPVNYGDLMITPELQARIEEAEKECREGRCVACRTMDELNSFLDSL